MSSFLEVLGASVLLVLAAFFLAEKSLAQPSNLPENTIYFVRNGEKTPLLIPQKAFWELKNDKTERPGVGKTESSWEKTALHVSMKGLLASLPGSWGRVGFSLIETAVTKPIQRSEGIVFRAKGTESAHFSVLVKDRQSHQPQGTLTFQWDFEAQKETTEYFAKWEDFVPTIRGQKVEGFELDLFSVHSLSFQISRSQQQKLKDMVPLEFELEL
jgi:hypothetical protein